jgi:site-specific recombinase XerD
VLMTLYASGARNSELTHLQVSDIDSRRMVVHIRYSAIRVIGIVG